jgi:hypothetical protein
MYTVAYIKDDRLATTLVFSEIGSAKAFMLSIVMSHPQLLAALHVIILDPALFKLKRTLNEGEFRIIAH